MYQCRLCGVAFDAPLVRKTVGHIGTFPYVGREALCPLCAQPYFDDADHCQCGAVKPKGEALCKACQVSMIRRCCDFFDTLTADEEEALNTLLDGCHVGDHGAWRQEYGCLKAVE